MIEHNFTPGFRVRLARRSRHRARHGEGVWRAAPGDRRGRSAFASLRAAGREELDHSALLTYIEDLAHWKMGTRRRAEGGKGEGRRVKGVAPLTPHPSPFSLSLLSTPDLPGIRDQTASSPTAMASRMRLKSSEPTWSRAGVRMRVGGKSWSRSCSVASGQARCGKCSRKNST